MAASTFSVERSATIAAHPGRVFEELVDFRNWPHWSPWEDLDPDIERTYSGPPRGTGSVYEWAGNRKAGKGRMEIIDTTEPERVQVDLRFLKPFKARNDCVFVLTPQGDSTHVSWSMSGDKSIVMRVMGVFVSMDKMIGPDFEKGLARLTAYAEGGRSA
ncbi:MAG: SRPBCC family protein [Nocardioides sp.]